MKTKSLTHIVLVIAIVTTSCGRSTVTAQCEPSPPAVSTRAKTASPPPERNGCPRGEGVNLRYAIEGDVCVWHASAPCKRKIHSHGDGPYDWADSGIPCYPGDALAVTLAEECYVRGNTNEVLEIVHTPNGIDPRALKLAGWRNCRDVPELAQSMPRPECK